MWYLKKIFLFSFILFLLFSCERPVDKITLSRKKSKDSLSTLVIYSRGESRILHSNLTEEKANLGAYFSTGDEIQTYQNSMVDIQVGSSSIIRIKQNSILRFELLTKTDKSAEITVFLERGKALVQVNKTAKTEEFVFLTPSASTTVKGTSIILGVDEDKNTYLKVVNGVVSISHNESVLEEKIKNLPEEQQLVWQKALKEKKDLNLGEENQALITFEKVLNPKKLIPTNSSKLLQKWKNLKIQTRSIEITKREEQELNTMVTVEMDKADQIIRINEELSSGVIDEAKADRLERERLKLEKEINDKQSIEKEKFNEAIAVKPRKFKSNKEIIQYYERIEKVILIDGKIEYGAIIDQIGNSLMIVHTERGIKRIPMDQVMEVIYDYQTRNKFYEAD
ncbi:MAG: FecR domain-containing protein [Leptospiraceae bacterium]|nr:FecR domain-containing protein [Leptospiraceae bacterium]